MDEELPRIARVHELAVLQTEQDFGAAWNRLDDDKRSEHRQRGDTRIYGPFQRKFQTTIDGALSFEHVIKTIRKITSFSLGEVNIYYGNLFHLNADVEELEQCFLSSDFGNFEISYILTPSQHSPPTRYQYDPDITASHLQGILQAKYGVRRLSLSLGKEAWLLEEDLPDEATGDFLNSYWPYSLSFKFETPSQKPYSMWLKYISPHVLPSMAPWTKKILSCIGINGIPEYDGTSLERWFESFLGAVGLSGLKYLRFYNSEVSPEIWQLLSEISTLERLHISSEYACGDDTFYHSDPGLCLDFTSRRIDESGWHLLSSRLKEFKSLQHVTVSDRSLTLNAVEILIKGIFKSDTIHHIRFYQTDVHMHPTKDEKLKHHLNMNKVGRRIIYRSPNLIPALAPNILAYAAKEYPLTGVFTLLRNHLDLAKVFGATKKRKREP